MKNTMIKNKIQRDGRSGRKKLNEMKRIQEKNRHEVKWKWEKKDKEKKGKEEKYLGKKQK